VRPPTEAELRAGERAVWGDRPTRMRVISFRPLVRNTLRGFIEIELPSGLRVREISIHESHGKRWAGLPARPVLTADGRHSVLNGKKQYASLLEWKSRDLSDEFSRRIIQLVQERHPEAFNDSGTQ
jgi:hypothetical protein